MYPLHLFIYLLIFGLFTFEEKEGLSVLLLFLFNYKYRD